MVTQPTHTVTDAAAIVGSSPSQIRNWCTQFRPHLSPNANPGPGQPRWLSNADVSVLQRVKELRAAGTPYEAIPAQLPDPDQAAALQPYIDLQPTPTAQNALESTIDAKQVALLVESRFQGIQAKIEQLSRAQAASEQKQVGQITTLGIGIMIGMFLVVAVWAVFALASYLGS